MTRIISKHFDTKVMFMITLLYQCKLATIYRDTVENNIGIVKIVSKCICMLIL